MTPAEALLVLVLTAGPAVEATFRAPLEKGEVADVARELVKRRGWERPVVEMRDPEAGRERLRAWCRDEAKP